MTRDEVKLMFAGLARYYPPNLMISIDSETVNVWTDALGDLDGKTVLLTVKAWAQINKYPPSIADIRERVARPALDAIETPEQAWTRVYKAIGKYGRTEPDMARLELGEDLWAMVGRDWSYYCLLLESDMPNEKARFIRAYTAQMGRRKEQAQIAPKVLAALDSGKLRLEAGDD